MELHKTTQLTALTWVLDVNERELIISLANENDAIPMDLLRYLVINFIENETWKQQLLTRLYSKNAQRLAQ